MSNTLKSLRVCIVIVLLCSLVGAQSTNSTPSPVVPPLVNFSGVLTDVNGKPLTGIVGVTFYLYEEQQGGAPLWIETQNVQPDKNGNYSVMLGATSSTGLPANLFASGEAHWLGVQAQGQPEQPRVMLLSVPYALKAGDAQTVGGLPASAFVLAAPAPSGSGSTAGGGPLTPSTSPVVVGSGTPDFVPLWTNLNVLGNSVLFQSGSGSSAQVGINTTTPAATLDVNGGVISRGALQLPSTGTATASQGYNSQPFSLQGSAFNSSTGKAIGPLFQWQTEPSGNDTSSPAGTLNLLYGNGSGSPSETGLNIASNGKITFASGQTFPGAGTITGITTASGSGLSGGGTSGNLSLSLVNTCAANQVLQWNGSAWACSSAGTGTITGVTAGTDLTGGGTSGNVTLNVDTTKVPQLGAANTFAKTNTFNGSITFNAPTTFQASNNVPIYATSSSPGYIVVEAEQNATSGGSTGVYGQTSDSSGYGVWGYNEGQSGNSIGVYGLTFAASGYPVAGVNGAASGQPVGVYGQAFNCSGCGYGVYGSAGGAGVYGYTNAPAGYGVYGANAGLISEEDGGYGVLGVSSGPGAFYGVAGIGFSEPTGSSGYGTGGMLATGGNASGDGFEAGDGIDGFGGYAPDFDGEGGAFSGGTGGVDYGDGVLGIAGSGDAGAFEGNVDIEGNLTKSSGSFKIDHPLDPSNKYLYHSFVESPDMKNIYDGVATLDGNGEAVIQMPEWFGVLNRDFRYQLTCIGGFAPVFIAEKLANNQFKIGGGRAGMEVSWQITGIRQDAWANAHRIPVEEEKEARLKGYYIHPELYGAPPEKQIEWARHPQTMKRMQEIRQRMKENRMSPPQSAAPLRAGTK